MRHLSALAWRSLEARKLRSFLTAAGIALGVSVLFASLSAGVAMDAAVGKAAADEMGQADLRVEALEESGLTQATSDVIAGLPGVAIAAPALERRTYLSVSLSQTASAQLPPPVTVLGIDPVLEPKIHSLPLDACRRLAAGGGSAALVTQTLADQENLRTGDSISIRGAATGSQSYEIVGVVSGNGPIAEAEGRLIFLTLPAAQTLFGTQAVTRIDLGAASGTSVDELIGQLEASIHTQPYLLTQAQDLAAALGTEMTDFAAALLLVAAVVLFAGAFLIFNTLSMTVAEVTREVGLLRAAGATRSQVMGLILLQALALGTVGSAVGVAAGAGLAAFTLSWIGTAGHVALAAPSLSPRTIGLAFSIGVVLTLAAALEPAWRAGRISPVEALRRGPPSAAAGAARLRWLVVVFVVLMLVGLAVWPGGNSGYRRVGSLASVGATSTVGSLILYGLLLVTVLLLPSLLGPAIRVGGIPFRLFRNEERLARSWLSRDRSRTALTAGALVVGVAMIVALGTAAQDVRKIGTSWLAETIPGSELLTSIRPVQTADPIVADLAAVEGVKSVSPIGLFGVGYVSTASVDGREETSIVRQEAAAIDGADYLADGRLVFLSGDRTAALRALGSPGSVIVPKSLADDAGMHVEDDVEFVTGSGRVRLHVVGVVAHSIPSGAQEAILVGWSDARTVFAVQGADVFAVRYEPGWEPQARPQVDTLAASYALEPNRLNRVSGTVGDALDRLFQLLDALALISVVVAGLGMVNTLSMGVLERVREIGVLRATGMTSRQVWGMVVVDAGILAIVGSAIGTLVGLLVGVLLVAMSSAGFGLILDPPWISIALALCFSIVISIAASVYPAGLASHVSMVEALTHE